MRADLLNIARLYEYKLRSICRRNIAWTAVEGSGPSNSPRRWSPCDPAKSLARRRSTNWTRDVAFR